MLNWWPRWAYRERLAREDATILIARYGVRANHIANVRSSALNCNRRPYHWKHVHSIISQLLPYDGDDEDDSLLKGDQDSTP
jgi:hypothetical protein